LCEVRLRGRKIKSVLSRGRGDKKKLYFKKKGSKGGLSGGAGKKRVKTLLEKGDTRN